MVVLLAGVNGKAGDGTCELQRPLIRLITLQLAQWRGLLLLVLAFVCAGTSPLATILPRLQAFILATRSQTRSALVRPRQ